MWHASESRITKDHLGKQGVNGSITLKFSFKKSDGREWIELIGLMARQSSELF